MMKKLWELPVPSTSLLDDVTVDWKNMDFSLRCTYRNGAGNKIHCTIRFDAVIGYLYLDDLFTPLEIIKAYDTVVEFQNSEWLAQFEKQNSKQFAHWAPKHYAIYFDGEGSYQVVARNFDVHEEEV